MKKILKSTLREIKKTIGRFLGILVIITIGCAFYTGLKSVGPDMKIAADKYFSKYNLMDFHIISTTGFNDDDIKAFEKADGINKLEASYSIDVLGSIGKEQKVVKIISIPEKINVLQLKSGRMPEKSGECVLLERKNALYNQNGSTIKLISGTNKELSESLNTQTYTVVGIVTSPIYITRELGASKIGTGSVQEVAYIPKDDFRLPVYTDLNLTIKGSAGYNTFSESQKNLILTYQNSLESLVKNRADVRYKEMLEEASNKLNEKQTESNNSEKKLQDKKDEYQSQIADTEKKLKDAEEKLLSSQKEQDKNEAAYDDGVKELESRRSHYNIEISDMENKLKMVSDQLVGTQKQIEEQEKEIIKQKSQIEAAKAAGTLSEQKLETMEAVINDAEVKLSMSKQQFAKGKADYNKSKAALDNNKMNINQELNKAESKLGESKIKMDDVKNRFEEGQADIEKRKKELIDKKIEAQKEFDKAEKDLADAKVKLADAKLQIDGIEKLEGYVLGRELNVGYADFSDGTERVGGLAEILPFMVFIVAALISLTSMTRMVDEHRTQIGTLKALGYGKTKIAFKYIFYAASASILGSIIGLVVGFKFIPRVIFGAYESIYTLPLNVTAIYPHYAVGSASVGIAVTVLAAYFVCNSSLSVAPSELMRPQAPKSGKRLILERLSFLWKRLNFSQKVTMRNIFRYKKRFMMTVFGVACCCALVLSGFGLRNSIRIPAQRQFNEIFTYSSFLKYKNTATEKEKQDVQSALEEDRLVVDTAQCYVKNMEVKTGNIKEDIVVIIPQKQEKLDQFIHILRPDDKKKIVLSDDSVVLTEKVADILNVEKGSIINMVGDNEKTSEIKVGEICENYLQNYMFITPEYYESVFGEAPVNNQVMIIQSHTSEEKQSDFAEKMMSLQGVSSITFLNDLQKNFNESIDALDLIVWVILISACLLALVVLYTLTTININERMREIATIKVLGFFDKEVNSYIFRECYILTLIGILLGMLSGIALHQKILDGASVKQIMYYKHIMPMSFVYSALLTFIISFVVNKLLQKKMKNIDMVEALKSVE